MVVRQHLVEGDRVHKRNGTAFSNGKKVCTVMHIEQDIERIERKVWLVETKAWIEEDKLWNNELYIEEA